MYGKVKSEKKKWLRRGACAINTLELSPSSTPSDNLRRVELSLSPSRRSCLPIHAAGALNYFRDKTWNALKKEGASRKVPIFTYDSGALWIAGGELQISDPKEIAENFFFFFFFFYLGYRAPRGVESSLRDFWPFVLLVLPVLTDLNHLPDIAFTYVCYVYSVSG